MVAFKEWRHLHRQGHRGGTKSSTGLVNANESSHTHSPGTFATSIGLSGSASYLTGTVTFADITHVHATSAGGGGTYVTTDAASLNATFTVWGAGVVHYAKTTDIGSLNFFNTLGPQSSASVGIAGGSYSLTGSNSVSGTSSAGSAHTHSISTDLETRPVNANVVYMIKI